jgi:hypothetical protein
MLVRRKKMLILNIRVTFHDLDSGLIAYTLAKGRNEVRVWWGILVQERPTQRRVVVRG